MDSDQRHSRLSPVLIAQPSVDRNCCGRALARRRGRPPGPARARGVRRSEAREPRRHRICPVRERAGTRQPKPGPESGCLAESGSFESCGHYRKGGTHARIERLKLPPGSLRASVRSMNRSVSEHPWTQQNRARIGFAVFPLSAPPEPLSGSMRNRKSRGHARISIDSPTSTKTDGLDGGAEGI